MLGLEVVTEEVVTEDVPASSPDGFSCLTIVDSGPMSSASDVRHQKT
jgi:hypothetical protein